MKMRVALAGASGQLGTALQKIAPPDWQILPLSRPDLSVEWLDHHRPAVIVNAAAYNAVEQAEHEPGEAREINARLPARLAHWAAGHGAYMVHFSTDYVFAGTENTPIPEDTPTAPLNAYGASKAEGEKLFRESGAKGCIIRTSGVFGKRKTATGAHNFIEKILARAADGQPFPVRSDLTFRPTWAEDLAGATVEKVEARAAGIFHCTSAGQTTWCEWAREILARTGKNPHLVEACHGDPPGQARRPLYTVLDDIHHHRSTDWLTALDIYLRNREA